MRHALVLLSAATLACATSQPDGLDRVRAVVLPYLTFMPFHIAQAEGYFTEQGLEVEFIRLARNQEIMTALARSDVDVSAGMLTVNELSLVAAGERIRMVAELGYLAADACTFAAFVARRSHLESGALADPQRLAQLRFDTDLLLPLGYWADAAVAPLQLTVDDLNLVNLPSSASVPALLDGSLDVTIESEPYLTALLQSGDTAIWHRVEDLLPGYVLSMLMYGPGLLDQRPEVGERFAVAMLRAIRQFAEGKTDRNVAIAREASGLEEEQLRKACWPALRRDGRIDPASLRPYQEWNVARGYVERALADAELFDHRFIDRAAAILDSR